MPTAYRPDSHQRPRVRLVLGQPRQLGAGEVGVEAQAGELGDAVLVAVGAQPVADVGRTTVLPHDGAAGRAERLAVPQHDGLALVGDADRRQLGLVDLGQDLARRLEGGLPDLLGGVLDPAGLREVLPELLVALGLDAAVGGDDDGGHAGGAGVDREDAHWEPPLLAADDLEDAPVDPRRPRAGVDAHLVVLRADPHVEAVLALGLGQRLQLDHQRVVDRHLLLGGRRRQVELVEVDEPGELRDRVGVVVDAQVDGDVVVPAVARPVAHDEQCRRLATAAVTSRVVAGGQRREQASLDGLVLGRDPCPLHRLHHLGTGEDVALDRVAAALAAAPGRPAGPGEALGAGPRRGVAVGVDDAHLPVLASLVLLDQPVEGDLRGRAVVEVRQPEVLEGEVGVGLRGDGADPGCRCRHGGPDGQELRGDGDAPGLAVVGPGHDREGHAPNIAAARRCPEWRRGTSRRIEGNERSLCGRPGRVAPRPSSRGRDGVYRDPWIPGARRRTPDLG